MARNENSGHWHLNHLAPIGTWFYSLALLLVFSATATAAEVAWIAIESDGPYWFGSGTDALGNPTEIYVKPGSRTEFNIRANGWHELAGSPKLHLAHAALDRSGLRGINAVPANPGIDINPISGPNGIYNGIHIVTKYCHGPGPGGFGSCGIACSYVPSIATPSCSTLDPTCFLCLGNPDFVFDGMLAVASVSTYGAGNVTWGGITNAGVCKTSEPGESYYVGTLILDVPADAAGAYEVRFDLDPAGTFMEDCDDNDILPGFSATNGKICVVGQSLRPAPTTAPYPHDRRKNRYISFDPVKTVNDGDLIAFRVELKTINMGSCNDATGGNLDFCRIDRGAQDCNSCVGGLGGTCVNSAIHCSTGGGVCTPTGATCVNDRPNSGGSNVGQVWWVGPENPSGNGVHLMVSAPFRKESTNWGTEFDPLNHPGEFVVHAGDCEIVPQASYGIRAFDVANTSESDELVVETTHFLPGSPPVPFWFGDAVGSIELHCNANLDEPSCTTPGDCGGAPCERVWSEPNNVVNFDDAFAVVATMSPSPETVMAETSWVDFHGGNGAAPPNTIINGSDLQQCIFGFAGLPYSGLDPADCPDVGTWP